MNRLGFAALAAAVIVLGVNSFAGAAGPAKPTLSVIDVVGPKVPVRPGMKDGTVTPKDFSKAFVRCPRGYYATGGGVYSGAVTEVASAPTTDRRGWFVDGFSTSANKTYTHRVAVACVKGNKTLRVRKATAAGFDLSSVEQEYLDAHPELTGR